MHWTTLWRHSFCQKLLTASSQASHVISTYKSFSITPLKFVLGDLSRTVTYFSVLSCKNQSPAFVQFVTGNRICLWGLEHRMLSYLPQWYISLVYTLALPLPDFHAKPPTWSGRWNSFTGTLCCRQKERNTLTLDKVRSTHGCATLSRYWWCHCNFARTFSLLSLPRNPKPCSSPYRTNLALFCRKVSLTLDARNWKRYIWCC